MFSMLEKFEITTVLLRIDEMTTYRLVDSNQSAWRNLFITLMKSDRESTLEKMIKAMKNNRIRVLNSIFRLKFIDIIPNRSKLKKKNKNESF